MKGSSIPQLSRFHVGLGLVFAVPLMIIGASGLLLGFHDWLRYGSSPYRLEEPAVQPVAPAALADAARSAYPGGRLEVLYLPTEPDRVARARLSGKEGNRALVFLDPATGKPVAVRDLAERDLVDWLYEVHKGAIAGLSGEIVAAAGAISLVLLWLSGLPLKRQGRRARSLHGRIGRAAGGVLALVALTGVLLSFTKPLREKLYPAPRTSVATPLPTVDIAQVVSAGSRVYIGSLLERVLLPVRGGQPVALCYQDGGRVWVDGANGQVLRTEPPYAPWINLLYPLHSGRMLGKLGPTLVAAFGVLLMFLIVSGYFLHHKAIKRGLAGGRRGCIFRGAN